MATNVGPGSIDPMGGQGHSPWDYAGLLRTERARLLELCESLEDDAWSAPTICGDWTVGDIVRHLVGDDLGYLSWIRDGHRGASPPVGTSSADFIDWLDGLQARWVDAAGRLSPRLCLELLSWLDSPVADAMGAQDPSATDAEVSWAGPSPKPNWLDHARELSERWLHRQQILDALGRSPDERSDVLDPVLDGLRWALPHGLSGTDAPIGSTVVAVVGGRTTWTLHRAPEGWAFGDDPSTPPTAVLMGTATTWWRHLSNNTRPGDPRLHAAGDPALIAALWSTRAIIGHPH